jgi:hypothetical protein
MECGWVLLWYILLITVKCRYRLTGKRRTARCESLYELEHTSDLGSGLDILHQHH